MSALVNGEHGFPVVDCGIARDDVHVLLKKLKEALSAGDIVVNELQYDDTYVVSLVRDFYRAFSVFLVLYPQLLKHIYIPFAVLDIGISLIVNTKTDE